ncbi:MAG TPA: hypothetical protein VGM91_23430 [Conexibacter sp.]|jgi:hypothetical protein
MANATGFLLRNNLSDTGTLPRSGGWTSCPDIIVAGTAAIGTSDLIASYGSITDKPLTQSLTNYLYIRSKNMNNAPLTQVAYLFQVDGSLVLRPEQWYSQNNLVGYLAKNPNHVGDDDTPDNPRFITQYQQTLSSQTPGEIVVTNGYTWAPDNTDHHCLVAVVADSWDAVLANYPDTGTMDGLAQWIYANPSLGWHNVNIQPITSTVYESNTAYLHSPADERITFTIIAENVPVGARVSFGAQDSTANGQMPGQDWTTVSAPVGGGSINPDFEVGTTLLVNSGYKTVFTYRTDFAGLPVPSNFKMHMTATKPITPTAQTLALVGGDNAQDSLVQSFHRAFAPTAMFRAPDGQHFGHGLDGFTTMLAATPWGGDGNGDDGDLDDTVIVVLGSHTTTPISS